ncbi:hypothetical protein [Lysobacter enzymogenes]|uniref:hypothetical protein n=1 Tax=Lysobacter enzymogenes TaxID=69 RepID=UPI000F4C36EB|nr:hypothetical protein [Lysobacter enzymogenes]
MSEDRRPQLVIPAQAGTNRSDAALPLRPKTGSPNSSFRRKPESILLLLHPLPVEQSASKIKMGSGFRRNDDIEGDAAISKPTSRS